MKIGDEVYVHGYVDEIRRSARNDTIIIRNEGGYFGTIENEIYHLIHIDEPETEFVRVKYHCINCVENGSYKCSKCDGEMYYKYDKDEPQLITDCK